MATWHLEIPPTGDPALAELRETLGAHADFFAGSAPVTIARAPGRLDLMGGIADYSGSLVLELPLAAGTFAAVQPADDGMVTCLSTNAASFGDEPVVSVPLESLVSPADLVPYAAARACLTAHPRRAWAAYVAGALVAFQHEHPQTLGARVRELRGLRLLVHSNVPVGKGVSSSAAVEVAAAQALCGALGRPLEGRALALLCQKVENLVAGAPCGVMDQMTAACGEQGRLLALRCQPAELEPPVELPPDVEVWGIDSGLRHAVSGADYGAVRAGAFMGYRIIAERAGLPAQPCDDGRVSVADARWQGYLANVPPSVWEAEYRDAVPETTSGAAFLARFGGTTDALTQLDPARTYAVRAPTAHPIYEHHRVRLFRALLGQRPLLTEHLELLGELMYQSHASYGACGLGTAGTDRLVALVREAGPAAGLYGAKITGGGSGGTVAVLAGRGARDAVERISRIYASETGRPSLVLGGSSPGAIRFGTLVAGLR